MNAVPMLVMSLEDVLVTKLPDLVSSQYAASTCPRTSAPPSTSEGNVSRSTDTRRPAGIASITERRNT